MKKYQIIKNKINSLSVSEAGKLFFLSIVCYNKNGIVYSDRRNEN